MFALKTPPLNSSRKMLAQPLLADAKLLGDVGLGDTKSRSTLDEGALAIGRLIFGGHLPFLSLC
jgi:hypothetical protein